ncbi:MAG: 50S ribosomal protein L9 [Bacteroidales bacterium]|nr:50S ribosomal protein L9 [Bacteroidales bacterium]
MEIILKQDVKNLGLKDDIVKVKNGYAANYLIPQGMAIMATPSAKKVHAENLRQRAHKEAKLVADAEALAAKLEGLTVKVPAKVSSNGKVFGSVGNIQVAEALAALGYEVDRKNIDMDAIKEVGVYDVAVKCYRNVKATLKVEVAGEDAAEAAEEKAE